jgi:hypothetical protein
LLQRQGNPTRRQVMDIAYLGILLGAFVISWLFVKMAEGV